MCLEKKPGLLRVSTNIRTNQNNKLIGIEKCQTVNLFVYAKYLKGMLRLVN